MMWRLRVYPWLPLAFGAWAWVPEMIGWHGSWLRLSFSASAAALILLSVRRLSALREVLVFRALFARQGERVSFTRLREDTRVGSAVLHGKLRRFEKRGWVARNLEDIAAQQDGLTFWMITPKGVAHFLMRHTNAKHVLKRAAG